MDRRLGRPDPGILAEHAGRAFPASRSGPTMGPETRPRSAAGARCPGGRPTSSSRTRASTTRTATSSRPGFAPTRRFAQFPVTRRKLEWQAQDTALCGTRSCTSAPRASARRRRPTCRPSWPSPRRPSSVRGDAGLRPTRPRASGAPPLVPSANQRDAASYKQVGNGVAVGAAWHVLRTHVDNDASDLPGRLVRLRSFGVPEPHPRRAA